VKLEWEGLTTLLKAEERQLVELLILSQTHEKSQFIRGQIDMVKWVIEMPKRQDENEEFERQRERASAGY
jgi:hypothetical protein